MRAGLIALVVDDRILAEYRDVLHRDYLRRYFSPQDCAAIVDYIEHEAHRTAVQNMVHDMPDAGDIPFLEAALAEKVPLVTGDKKHFPRNKRKGCRVLDPAEFLRAYFT